jgi:hypothetical protein
MRGEGRMRNGMAPTQLRVDGMPLPGLRTLKR